jgi:hypothetical protein
LSNSFIAGNYRTGDTLFAGVVVTGDRCCCCQRLFIASVVGTGDNHQYHEIAGDKA